MKIVFALFILAGLFLSTKIIHAQCADEDNILEFQFDGKKYEFVLESKSWSDAAACAVERGGYLVEINSAEEQAAIINYILNSGVPTNYSPVIDGGGDSYVWIGATDRQSEGNWIWDGKNLGQGTLFWTGHGAAGENNGHTVNDSYVNWGGKSTGTINEPDNYEGTQNAAAIGLTGWPVGMNFLGIAGEWNDINVNNQIYFVIEYEKSTGIIDKKASEVNIIGSPNPVADFFSIHNTNEINSISVYSVTGEKIEEISSINAQSFTLDFSNYSIGIYFLSIVKDNEIETIKIVKE